MMLRTLVMTDLKIGGHNSATSGSPDWKTRILRLEFQTEAQGSQLSTLTDKTNAMADSLGSIQRTLAQIRWIAIGAAVALTAKEMNLLYVLKFLGI